MAFVVFEGADGAGKSTLIKAFAKALRKKGVSFIMTKEPGGTAWGRKIRQLLLHEKGAKELCLEAETLLCFADRSQNIYENILPALKAKKWALSDRYFASTLVYQEMARGRASAAGLASLLSQRMRKIASPDLWVLADTPLKETLKRLGQGKKDRFEAQSASFHKKVRAAYKKLARMEPSQWIIVSGDKPVEKSIQAIFARLKARRLLSK